MRVGTLSYGREEGRVKLTDDFLSLQPVIRADILRDVIADLTLSYESALAESGIKVSPDVLAILGHKPRA